jgi:hypothetical protein
MSGSTPPPDEPVPPLPKLSRTALRKLRRLEMPECDCPKQWVKTRRGVRWLVECPHVLAALTDPRYNSDLSLRKWAIQLHLSKPERKQEPNGKWKEEDYDDRPLADCGQRIVCRKTRGNKALAARKARRASGKSLYHPDDVTKIPKFIIETDEKGNETLVLERDR